jgi:DNA-binding response OmpR family regulator
MATVLIAEPSPGIRQLFEIVVRMRGDEPVLFEHGSPLPDVDAAILDCSEDAALAAVRELRRRRPALPVICAGVHTKDPEADALAPVTYLRKPFSLAELDAALAAALS